MQTGTKISAFAHLVLISWAMLAGKFSSEPLPVEVREVSIISAAEFAALSTSPVTPIVAAEPVALAAPDPETATPELTVTPDATPQQEPPDQAQQPVADTVPDATPAAPAPVPKITEAPEAPEPPAAQVVVLPEPLAPNRSKRPKARPVQRVTPVAVAPPAPDIKPDEVTQPDIAQDDGADTPQETQEATAPEAASETIEPEAVAEPEAQANLAPTRSKRPKVRPPQRQQASPAPTTPTTPAQSAADTQSAVNDALAEALGGTQPTATADPPAATPSGPPLSRGEKDALRVAVQGCWNVGSLSSEALETTVVVGLSMGRDGKPDNASIRLLSSSGGSAAAAERAFDAARRAIIRCAKSGYDLPAEKYSHWQEIEMTFNPERMRIR